MQRILCHCSVERKAAFLKINGSTFLHYIFSEDDDPLGMKQKAVIKTNIAFKIKTNFFSISPSIQSGPKKMYTLFTHQYLWNKFK